jgi:chitinase
MSNRTGWVGMALSADWMRPSRCVQLIAGRRQGEDGRQETAAGCGVLVLGCWLTLDERAGRSLTRPAVACIVAAMHPRRIIRVLAATSLALAADACAPKVQVSTAPASEPPRIVGYLASWGVRSKGTRIAELPGAQLTHIIYAFARIGEDGRLALGDPCLDTGACDSTGLSRTPDGGNFAELRRLKERHPHLKLLVAAGGWTGSGRFSDVALTPESRRTFAQSAVDLVIRRTNGLFDGIDIDWEYPVRGGLATNVTRPEDRQNCTLLLQALRAQLDEQGARDGRRYLLTIATIAGPAVFAQLELGAVAATVDWLNVMTYDYHSGSKIAHFNAPLYTATGDPTPGFTVDSTVRRYVHGGVSPTKLVIGLPFYGRVYGGVASTNDGLFQPAPGPVPDEWRTGTDYRAITRRDLESLGFRRVLHPEARVPFLYNSANGAWITYDDAESVREKAVYARTHGLGGVMAWELGGDDGTLVRTVYDVFSAVSSRGTK